MRGLSAQAPSVEAEPPGVPGTGDDAVLDVAAASDAPMCGQMSSMA